MVLKMGKLSIDRKLIENYIFSARAKINKNKLSSFLIERDSSSCLYIFRKEKQELLKGGIKLWNNWLKIKVEKLKK